MKFSIKCGRFRSDAQILTISEPFKRKTTVFAGLSHFRISTSALSKKRKERKAIARMKLILMTFYSNCAFQNNL